MDSDPFDRRPDRRRRRNEIHWFALWTRSRHEQVVREQLERSASTSPCPRSPSGADRKKKIDWPLFPGYCFARFNPKERLPILKCTGIVNIISFEECRPATSSDLEIDGIRQLVESDLAADPCPMIREGMLVEVVHGPLRGVTGRLVRKNEKARLLLSVDLIGPGRQRRTSTPRTSGLHKEPRGRRSRRSTSVEPSPPLVVAPMAGMTDTAFRRLVKRQGGCGLVVTEMVSSEGLVRGIDRTLEFAEYTEEERPVSIQIFGGDPEKMADGRAHRRRHGRRHRRRQHGLPGAEDRQAQRRLQPDAGARRTPRSVDRAMTRAVKIPVTVKMRAGWNDARDNAPDAGARWSRTPARRRSPIHGRTADADLHRLADWDLVAPGRERPVDSRVRQRRLRGRRSRSSSGCASGVERCARRPRRAAQPLDPRAGRPTSRAGRRHVRVTMTRPRRSFCSTTSSCC